MKTGVYRVVLQVDGALVSGEAYIRQQSFTGLSGGIRHSRGTLAANAPTGGIDLRIDEASSALSDIRVRVERMVLMSISDRDDAQKAVDYVVFARSEMADLRRRLAAGTPGALLP